MTSLEGSICKGELVIYYEHQFLKYNNHTVKKKNIYLVTYLCRKTLKHCMCIYQKLSFSTDPLMSINRCNCLKWLKLLKFVLAYLICLFHRASDGGVTRVCWDHVPPSNQWVISIMLL